MTGKVSRGGGRWREGWEKGCFLTLSLLYPLLRSLVWHEGSTSHSKNKNKKQTNKQTNKKQQQKTKQNKTKKKKNSKKKKNKKKKSESTIEHRGGVCAVDKEQRFKSVVQQPLID